MADNFPYTVLMRDAETGEERVSGPYPFKFSLFWWTDGNFGCGCNRQAEWHRADADFRSREWVVNDEDDYIHPLLGSLFGECQDMRYEALYATLADGTIVNIDRENEPTDDIQDTIDTF